MSAPNRILSRGRDADEPIGKPSHSAVHDVLDRLGSVPVDDLQATFTAQQDDGLTIHPQDRHVIDDEKRRCAQRAQMIRRATNSASWR